ncbi:MAG TPA: DUF2760 domain-containing protein [Candidatus Acidoferrales bacterium]|nr:DUF2760 domain-containing protein [Candidatus Acidoferrales bacterium]
MDGDLQSELSLVARFALAWKFFWRILGNQEFARRAAREIAEPVPEAPKAAPVLPPERLHASGLLVLSLLQREGRLLDFLQENVAGFSDAEVGVAARVVHSGCKKALAEYFTVEPVSKDAEGAAVTLPAGFDAGRIRVTGNVAGQPPYRGTLKHHGWIASAVRLPAVSENLDPRVLTPAEVEL